MCLEFVTQAGEVLAAKVWRPHDPPRHPLKGCNKCLKGFSKKEFGAKMVYSGFERSSWESRTWDHIRYAGLSKRARTKAEQKIIEHKYGAR
ncbi:hypothetical protein N1851_034151 [Merluccius polli]|uniref:Uncharacterized protein n=1 Tax=Merluccius polli TaxID=89951 RepID=A0AA47M024_MERPO|nr:hypothetical protein N1851_034151 [Merluccius polli]